MSVAKNTLFFGKMNIKGGGRSWSEKFFLKATSRADAVRDMGYIVTARRMTIAGGFTVNRASVHRWDSKKDRSNVIWTPAGPLNLDTEAGPPIAIEASDNTKTCLQLSFESSEGDFNNRPVGAVRDSWITGNVLQFVPVPMFASGLLVPATHLVAGLTKIQALGNYIGVVRDLACIVQKDPAIVGNYNVISTPNWGVIDVTTRDRGSSAFGGRGRARVLANA